jgi:hypothetical protein
MGTLSSRLNHLFSGARVRSRIAAFLFVFDVVGSRDFCGLCRRTADALSTGSDAEGLYRRRSSAFFRQDFQDGKDVQDLVGR